MNPNPSILIALLQGLLTAAVLITPPLAFALFGGRLRVTVGDLALASLTFPLLAVVSIISFYPFDVAWYDVGFDVWELLRSLLIGGLILALGMLIAQRKALARGTAAGAGLRLGGAFLVGAIWGAAWGFSGWSLQLLEGNYHG